MTSSRWFLSTSVPTQFVAARVCLFGCYDFSNQHSSSFLNTLYDNDGITLYCVKMCYYCRSRYARKSLAAGRVKRPWQWPSPNCSCRRCRSAVYRFAAAAAATDVGKFPETHLHKLFLNRAVVAVFRLCIPVSRVLASNTYFLVPSDCIYCFLYFSRDVLNLQTCTCFS